MPRDITSADDLLMEMATEADKLGLHYSGNPNNLSEPVDALDASLDHFSPEEVERSLMRETPKEEWLDHEITELSDQPDDPEEIGMAQDTMQFFIEDLRYSPRHPEFEREFRAFLHCDDYSYSEKTIRHLIAAVLGLD